MITDFYHICLAMSSSKRWKKYSCLFIFWSSKPFKWGTTFCMKNTSSYLHIYRGKATGVTVENRWLNHNQLWSGILLSLGIFMHLSWPSYVNLTFINIMDTINSKKKNLVSFKIHWPLQLQNLGKDIYIYIYDLNKNFCETKVLLKHQIKQCGRKFKSSDNISLTLIILKLCAFPMAMGLPAFYTAAKE